MGVDCPDVGVLKVHVGLLPLGPDSLSFGFAEPRDLLSGVFRLSFLAGVAGLLLRADRKLLLLPGCLTVLLHVLQVTNSTLLESWYFFTIFASLKLSAQFLASRLRSFCILGVSLDLGLRRTRELSRISNWKQYGHVPSKVLLASCDELKAQLKERERP